MKTLRTSKILRRLKYRFIMPGETPWTDVFIQLNGAFHTIDGKRFFSTLKFYPISIIREAIKPMRTFFNLIGDVIENTEQSDLRIQGAIDAKQSSIILCGGDMNVEFEQIEKKQSDVEKETAKKMVELAKKQLKDLNIDTKNEAILKRFDIIIARKGPTLSSAKYFGRPILILFLKQKAEDRLEDYILPKRFYSFKKTFGMVALHITPLPSLRLKHMQTTKTFTNVYLIMPARIDITTAEEIATSGAKLGIVIERIMRLYQIMKGVEFRLIGMQQELRVQKRLADMWEGQAIQTKYDLLSEIQSNADKLPKDAFMSMVGLSPPILEKKNLTPFFILGGCIIAGGIAFGIMSNITIPVFAATISLIILFVMIGAGFFLMWKWKTRK